MATVASERPIDAAIVAINSRLDLGECQPLDAAKVRALMTGYDRHWSAAAIRVLTVEEIFRLPIINPESQRSSRTFVQAGRFDMTVELDRRHWLVEHKTSSEDIADPNGSYWRRLAIDSQVSMYALANWQDGRKIDGTLYDVIRKPTIRPKQITKADQKTMLSDRVYCGFAVSDADIAESTGIDYSETPRLYALRLTRDTFDNPSKYFQRRTVPRLDNEILEWAGELWQVAQDINRTRREGRHYRNSGACMNYGRPCDFLGICSGHDTTDSDKWRTKEHANSEIEMGPDALTYSRIRTYQTCKRLHHYKYDLRLERADDETAEALRFGHLLHSALESYFLKLQESQDGYHDEPAANEVAGCGQQQSIAF